MLRISVIRDSDQVVHLQLEGRLVGSWVEELRTLSEKILAQEKALWLDLQGVWFADRKGITLLRDLLTRGVCHLNSAQYIKQQLNDIASC